MLPGGWEHGQEQVLWEQIWASGGGEEIRTGKGTGEWEAAEGKCHGVLSVLECVCVCVTVGNCALCVLSPAALETDSRGHRA